MFGNPVFGSGAPARSTRTRWILWSAVPSRARWWRSPAAGLTRPPCSSTSSPIRWTTRSTSRRVRQLRHHFGPPSRAVFASPSLRRASPPPPHSWGVERGGPLSDESCTDGPCTAGADGRERDARAVVGPMTSSTSPPTAAPTSSMPTGSPSRRGLAPMTHACLNRPCMARLWAGILLGSTAFHCVPIPRQMLIAARDRML